MPAVSRITDRWTGICCCHSNPTCIGMGGKIIAASGDSSSAGLGTARISDMVIGDCGHPGKIVTGSGSNLTNSLGKATIGSQVTGCTIGKVITGSPTHDTGL